MALKNVQLRLDEELKASAENILEDLGLDMPTALRLFLKKVVSTRGIPFPISLEDEAGEKFSASQVKAILAAREKARDPATLAGPFTSSGETQDFLNSLKRKQG